jgi:hypothetical protein
MAFVGDYAGQWVGEWLGQALNPGAMYASLSGVGNLSAEFEQTTNVGDGIGRHRHISPAAARAIIERSLKLISQKAVDQTPPKQTKKPKATTQKPAAADAIAAQSQAFLEAEKAFLVEQAVSQVIEMATALDAEIKAEFAAIEIANQLQTFEEEMLFMFMMACEA